MLKYKRATKKSKKVPPPQQQDLWIENSLSMELARKSTSAAFGGSFLSHLLTNRLYRAVGVSAFGLVALYFYNRISRNQGDVRSHTRNPQVN